MNAFNNDLEAGRCDRAPDEGLLPQGYVPRHGACVLYSLVMIQRYQQKLMRVLGSNLLVTRLVAIFVAGIVGVTTGWVAAFALHRLVNPAPPIVPAPAHAAAPASTQSPTNEPVPGTSDKPDVIIAIPKHGGGDQERYRYLSLGQIIKGIEGARHGKKKHREGKDGDDRD